ncbi:6-phosphogluconolactonase (cycloisomerase 2 family) [Actinoallomurus bryophytorum]|uniref:6-phosphogluconolactonase (Cycloisomerase 2 family) n=1 Tax=Actinoallomurus bryophytorum TaxID=1490222 RepID=A0A543CQA7_9ACTN|nr:beta-propeller fold lactonase family protein [Actinoallomurus bryophytorum]TQL99275.1 6-phosphogluconolactonase (cycloisomerase 2 family) [Actinoallomurus bryophytorum]
MKTIARIAIIGAAAAAAAASAALPASAANTGQTAPVFVQTDDPSGNTVVAYHRAADGTLTRTAVYPTGGLGGVAAGSVVDHLTSQGSLAYDRSSGLLYAVNAGSDTITVFAVHGDRLQRTQIISTGGSFPNSIAARGGLVYVLNGLKGGSIQGFTRVGDRLVRVPGWKRGLGLSENGGTPAEVAFTPDGSKLVVTTRGNADSVEVFSVGLLGPAAKPVVYTKAGSAPFGFTFDARGHLVVTESGLNDVATFAIARDGRLTRLDEVATGQAATCWVVRNGDHVYASNAGSANLSRYKVGGTGSLTALGETATDAGTVDAAVSSDGRDLYVQTGANGVVDEFRTSADGSLTRIGSVTVPGAVGGEGIAAA